MLQVLLEMLRGSLMTFGVCFLGPVGALWGLLGAPGASWSHLGHPWGLSGAFQGPSGVSQGPSGSFWFLMLFTIRYRGVVTKGGAPFVTMVW